jgi:lipid-binding SYLF domain-containing protein
MKKTALCLPAMILAGISLSALPMGCDSASKLPPAEQAAILKDDAQGTIERCKTKFPATAKEFTNAYGYAVYPEIGKGGLVVGGFRGTGLVYEGGKLVANSVVGGGTIGAQIGGQSYAQVIFFKDKMAFDRFKRGETAFQAGASAVAANAGASTAIDYKNGVAVVAFGAEGLMVEGVIGGQTFTFEPIK